MPYSRMLLCMRNQINFGYVWKQHRLSFPNKISKGLFYSIPQCVAVIVGRCGLYTYYFLSHLPQVKENYSSNQLAFILYVITGIKLTLIPLAVLVTAFSIISNVYSYNCYIVCLHKLSSQKMKISSVKKHEFSKTDGQLLSGSLFTFISCFFSF